MIKKFHNRLSWLSDIPIGHQHKNYGGVDIKQVDEGLVDIGNSGRKPSEAELKKYPLKMHQWAIDGVDVVVNPDNPVKSLSTAQLKDIYAGKLTNWKALGGPDKTINLYTRDKPSGTRAVF